jgi:hypothetical protein
LSSQLALYTREARKILFTDKNFTIGIKGALAFRKQNQTKTKHQPASCGQLY